MSKKIKIMKHGPYHVSEGIPLNQALIEGSKHESHDWAVGENYEDGKKEYALCRCGHSSKKPYCDGNHIKHNFVGEEVADNIPYDEKAEVYEGAVIDIMDQEELCASARFCDVGNSVWNDAINAVSVEEQEKAIETTNKCPAGRLVIRWKNGEKIEPELKEEISVVEDEPNNFKGPLWVKGGIEIESADGKIYEVRNRVTLCRCGESRNMPFCDSSHYNCPHMKETDQ